MSYFCTTPRNVVAKNFLFQNYVQGAKGTMTLRIVVDIEQSLLSVNKTSFLVMKPPPSPKKINEKGPKSRELPRNYFRQLSERFFEGRGRGLNDPRPKKYIYYLYYARIINKVIRSVKCNFFAQTAASNFLFLSLRHDFLGDSSKDCCTQLLLGKIPN